MPSDLFKKEGNLIGIFMVFTIDLAQRLHARGFSGGLSHGGNPLGRDIIGRCDIVVYLQRVTITLKCLHLKRGVDESVAGGKCIPLSTG